MSAATDEWKRDRVAWAAWGSKGRIQIPCVVGGYKHAPLAAKSTKVRVRFIDRKREVGDLAPASLTEWQRGEREGFVARANPQDIAIARRIINGEDVDEVLRSTLPEVFEASASADAGKAAVSSAAIERRSGPKAGSKRKEPVTSRTGAAVADSSGDESIMVSALASGAEPAPRAVAAMEAACKSAEEDAVQPASGNDARPRPPPGFIRRPQSTMPPTEWSALLDLDGEALLRELSRMVDANGVDARMGDKKSTALVEMATIGQIDAVRQLLAAAAGINLRDEDGVTAVMSAASNGHLEVVSMLVRAAARIDLRSSPAVLNEFDVSSNPVLKRNGITARQWALMEGHQAVADFLRESACFQVGDDVECLDCRGGWYGARIMDAEYAVSDDERTATRYHIHFLGWKETWDEWVDASSGSVRWSANRNTATTAKHPAMPIQPADGGTPVSKPKPKRQRLHSTMSQLSPAAVNNLEPTAVSNPPQPPQPPPPSELPPPPPPPAPTQAPQRKCGTPGCSLPDNHGPLPDGRLHESSAPIAARRSRLSNAVGDEVAVVKHDSTNGNRSFSSSGTPWPATILNVRGAGEKQQFLVHFFGWSASHDEWVGRARLRAPSDHKLTHIGMIPEGERDADDEASVALLVERANVTDYLLILGGDSRWRFAEIVQDREGESGREALARAPPGKLLRGAPTWQEWIPCSEAHRFRCACRNGHLMMRTSSGSAFECDDCYDSLPASAPHVWCPMCSIRCCLGCANVRGTDRCAAKDPSRRETIETSRTRPPLAGSGASATVVQLPPTAVPTLQQRRGMDRLRRLSASHPGYTSVAAKLCESVPEAREIEVYEIDHAQARQRFEFELTVEPALRDTAKLLWHSTGGWKSSADPLDVIGSRFGFDPTYATHGTYGTGALCFAEYATYCARLLPCHRSVLDRRPNLSSLPRVGDDILLDGESAVYEVTSVGTGSDPNECRLRQLVWHMPHHDHGAGKEHCTRLGDGNAGTSRWASADVQYLILADVALGRCRDYGKTEPNIKAKGDVRTDPLPREPDGCHSVFGTEQECAAALRSAVPSAPPPSTSVAVRSSFRVSYYCLRLCELTV